MQDGLDGGVVCDVVHELVAVRAGFALVLPRPDEAEARHVVVRIGLGAVLAPVRVLLEQPLEVVLEEVQALAGVGEVGLGGIHVFRVGWHLCECLADAPQLGPVDRGVELAARGEGRLFDDGSDAALRERLAGLHGAVGADAEVVALEFGAEELGEPVHEVLGEGDDALVVAADALEAEGVAERAQELRADGVVGGLGGAAAEDLAKGAVVVVLLDDLVALAEVGDGLVASEAGVAEGVECGDVEAHGRVLSVGCSPILHENRAEGYKNPFSPDVAIYGLSWACAACVAFWNSRA